MAGLLEQEKIFTLKKALGDLSDDFPDLEDDLYLLMWLKGVQLDVEKAEQKIRKSFAWREKVGFLDLDKSHSDPEIDDQIFCKKDGVAKDGTAVISFAFGNTKMKTIYSSVGPERWDKYWKKILRAMEQGMISGNRRRNANNTALVTVDDVQGAYVITDYQQVAFMQYSSPSMMGYFLSMSNDVAAYFPDIVRRLHFLNPPFYIVPTIKLIDKIIGGPGLSLVTHTGKNAVEKYILPLVDRDQFRLLDY